MVLGVLFLAIQFVPVNKVNLPVEEEIEAPADVATILRESCYDCHSGETRWPWYSHLAPVSWLIAHDVDEGGEYLNLSTWNRYGPEQRAELLEEICDEVVEGAMPPWYYLPMHRGARLSEADRARLLSWVRSRAEWMSRDGGGPSRCLE